MNRHSSAFRNAEASFKDMCEQPPPFATCGICLSRASKNENDFPYHSEKWDEDVCAVCWRHRCNRIPEEADRMLEKHDLPPAA
ncbi:MAG: hypothetical protein JWN50_789 [Parcubacteria group bacterium]|nr:hypothetical protein [Parcubacteria group bacterium]